MLQTVSIGTNLKFIGGHAFAITNVDMVTVPKQRSRYSGCFQEDHETISR